MLTATMGNAYDHPNITVTRYSNKSSLGGAATTKYGTERFWTKAVVKAVHAVVTVADAANSAWTVYYSPVDTPDGSADVALGTAWTVSNSAAGTEKTILLNGLTASGALKVDSQGFPIFEPGDALYLKSGASNGANGRIDVGIEWKLHPEAKHN